MRKSPNHALLDWLEILRTYHRLYGDISLEDARTESDNGAFESRMIRKLAYRQALARLTPLQRTVLQRLLVYGQTFQEIARDMRRAPSTVHEHAASGARNLKRLLQTPA